MKFDYVASEDELKTLLPRALALLLYFDNYSTRMWSKECVVTCIRNGHRPGGPHHEGRAFDCRSHVYTGSQIADIVAHFNTEFHRWAPSELPTCIFHDSGSGKHLHFQVGA